MRKNVLKPATMCIAMAFSICAQYPEMVSVPVTYYDYRVDGSNPDFNPHVDWVVMSPRVITGMTDSVLSEAYLPVRGSACRFSFGIERWFRPWQELLPLIACQCTTSREP